MKVVIKNMDKSVLRTIDEVAEDINMQSWREKLEGNDVILNDAWLDVINEHPYINIDDELHILLFPNAYDEIVIKKIGG